MFRDLGNVGIYIVVFFLGGRPHFSQELQNLQEEAWRLRTEAVEKQQDMVFKEKARHASRGLGVLGFSGLGLQAWRVGCRD